MNVGIIGIGNHAIKNIIPAVMQSKNLNLIGIASRSISEKNINLGNKRIIIFPSCEDLISNQDIDTVIVTSPVGLHYYYGKMVLKSGKNLWCEKSLVSSFKEAKSLNQLSIVNGVDLKEMFMFLYHPQFNEIKKIAESGKIGKVKSISAKFGFPHLDKSDIRYNSQLGGGSLLDAGCYPIAAAHSLFGGKPQKVVSNIFSDDDYEVDTSGCALFTYSSGQYAIMEWGFGKSYHNEIELWGDKGSLKAERIFSKPSNLETKVILRDSNGNTEEIFIPAANHFVNMFTEFIKKSVPNDWILDQSNLIHRVRDNSQ